MSYNYLPLDKSTLTFQQVKHFLKYDQLVSITFAAHEGILKCREYLNKKLEESDELFYGINTGFGFLQNVQIDKDQLRTLHSNLYTRFIGSIRRPCTVEPHEPALDRFRGSEV